MQARPGPNPARSGANRRKTRKKALRRVNSSNPVLLEENTFRVLLRLIFCRARCNLSVMKESLDSWFKREILVHEAALVRYLTRTWSNRQEIHDLRQDTYVRVFEAAAKSRPHAPRAFLFATARHLMTDRIRRQRIVSIDSVGDLDVLNVMIEDISPEQRLAGHQELRRLAQAMDLLPPKCRETVWMRRVDDIPQKEVAVRLGIAQKTVEKHVAKGMKLLAAALFGSGPEKHSAQAGAGESDEGGEEHGQS
jgi:RNA polymerase sigma factor (sigma-70 family)